MADGVAQLAVCLETSNWIIVVAIVYGIKVSEENYFVFVRLEMLDVAGEIAPEALSGIGSVVALRSEEVPLLGEAGCNAACVD